MRLGLCTVWLLRNVNIYSLTALLPKKLLEGLHLLPTHRINFDLFCIANESAIFLKLQLSRCMKIIAWNHVTPCGRNPRLSRRRTRPLLFHIAMNTI
jgi:hypothetical protein